MSWAGSWIPTLSARLRIYCGSPWTTGHSSSPVTPWRDRASALSSEPPLPLPAENSMSKRERWHPCAVLWCIPPHQSLEFCPFAKSRSSELSPNYPKSLCCLSWLASCQKVLWEQRTEWQAEMTVSEPKGGADNGKHAVGHGAFFKADRLSEDKVMGLMKPQQISIRKTSMKTTKFSASACECTF